MTTILKNNSYVNKDELYKVSEVKLSYRRKINTKFKINDAVDAYRVSLHAFDKGTIQHRESVKVLLIDNTNNVLGIFNVAEGGINSSIIDIRLVMQAALLANAVSIILVHNHPTGILKPSQPDISIARKIKKAGEILNVQLLDSIIISESGYLSFAEEDLLN